MEIQAQALIGEFLQQDGDAIRLRQGKSLDLIVSELQPRYFEHASRQRVFAAASQAAQAVSVALTTTYTGLCVSNPIQSNVIVVPLQVGLTLSVAPAGIATLGLIGGYSNVDVAHTTPLTTFQGLLKGGSGVAKADSAATIPTPIWLQHIMSGFTAAALPATGPQLIPLDGVWVLPPGAFIAIGALTAVTGLWSMTWLELPAKLI